MSIRNVLRIEKKKRVSADTNITDAYKVPYGQSNVGSALDELTDTWHEVSLINSVENYLLPTRYKKIGDAVTLDIHVKTPSSSGVIAFTLPSGHRPPQQIRGLITSGGTGSGFTYIVVSDTGDVTIIPAGTGNVYGIGVFNFMI